MTQTYEEPSSGGGCGRRSLSATDQACRDCAVHSRAFCAVLDDKALLQLEALHSFRDLSGEDSLFMEGDDATYFYTILSGAFRLSKLLPDGRRQIIGFALPGEFMGLSVEDNYICNAEALTGSRLCRFSVTDLKRIGRKNPEMDRQLLTMTNATLSQAQDHMLLLGRMNAKEKIASFLCSLMKRAAAADQPKDPIALPMSRADIADYLGLTIETVSRTFTRLKTDKIISLPDHAQVKVDDMAALVSLAEG
ncbi:MAG: helix-turn-helix domain-containing protein [Rhodospirillaceae bacterium]|nr:helix-turn-helix domain-containing protein [Rhodospirillaceae bacterium]MBT4042081.1 helix-turn-helix domain-containing protein [Rhodospirillaceae bacterium]MBT4688291.1 helix-turn-helix domain-containing protein [Rhodospirillaceae bacterium]MBT5079284.1 helix-turn-helix domain-containing protein [Rhodospirillaceae bacterium]MBT5525744.1 helix-turn-helix domain-containing protein [Rhodospirillaceae bacterium]